LPDLEEEKKPGRREEGGTSKPKGQRKGKRTGRTKPSFLNNVMWFQRGLCKSSSARKLEGGTADNGRNRGKHKKTVLLKTFVTETEWGLTLPKVKKVGEGKKRK